MELRRKKVLLATIAILFIPLAGLMVAEGMDKDNAAAGFYLVLAAIFALSGLIPTALLLANAPIGRIDKTGILFKPWGVGLVPWGDIESFSIFNPGEGGPIIRLHLRNGGHYFSRIGYAKRFGATFRRAVLGTPFVIYASNIDRHMTDVVAEIRRRVPERAPVA